MSKTTTVLGKITEFIGGDYEIYSEKSIADNAQKTIINNAGNGIFFKKPKQSPTIEKTTTECIVEFRTKQDGTYTGQFGYDWLRIDDNGLTSEAKYEDCIENGYEAPNGKVPNRDSNTEYESKDEAFKALKKQYVKLKVDIVPKPATAPFTKDYFVPYLSLFSKPYSDAVTVPTGMPKPPYEAELRTLVEVGGTDAPDEIRVEFDENYFEINGKDGTDAHPVLISDKAIGTKREATADSLKIKCIKAFSSRQEIRVYNYPKGTAGKTKAEKMAKRKLAGKIIVLPNKNGKGQNPVKNVKELKMVLVQVKTNINGTVTSGIYNPDEKINLFNALNQALIFTKNYGNEILDLTNDDNFKLVGSNGSKGKYIDNTGNIIRMESTLNLYMRDLVDRNTANKYKGGFYVFSFDVLADNRNTMGRVEDIGKKSVVLYKVRDNFTLNHEVLHGLGLFHTHRDGIITRPNQKFTFIHAFTDHAKATNNVMSYQPDGKTTWQWQWEIMKSNIK